MPVRPSEADPFSPTDHRGPVEPLTIAEAEALLAAITDAQLDGNLHHQTDTQRDRLARAKTLALRLVQSVRAGNRQPTPIPVPQQRKPAEELLLAWIQQHFPEDLPGPAGRELVSRITDALEAAWAAGATAMETRVRAGAGKLSENALAYAQRAEMALRTDPPDFHTAGTYADRASDAAMAASCISRALAGDL